MTGDFDGLYGQLNDAQKEAVGSIDGPVMVVAGPGTGKTQVLTLRIANILKQTDTPPESILALTFTESAVRSMRKRLNEVIGPAAYKVSISTFHGFCNGLIQEYPEEFPRIVGAKLIPEGEQVQIIKGILESKKFEYIKPYGDVYYYVRPLLASIKELKREGVTSKEYEAFVTSLEERVDKADEKKANPTQDKRVLRDRELLVVYEMYQKELDKRRLYDFEDVIVETIKVLNQEKEFLLKLQEKYHYFLADEHQDVNRSQNIVLERLASFHDHPNVFVVGDQKQAVFRFQGASLENFLYFKDRYPDAKLINLTGNYRSQQTILDAAHSTISKGGVDEEPLVANADHPLSPIDQYEFATEANEVQFVVKDVRKKIDSGVEPQEIAILFRDNADVLPLVPLFRQAGISVSLSAEQGLFEKAIVVKLIDLLNVIDDPSNDVVLGRVLYFDFLKLPIKDVYNVAKNKAIFDVLESNTSTEELHSKILQWRALAHNGTLLDLLAAVFKNSGIIDNNLNKSDAADNLRALERVLKEVEKLIYAHPSYRLSDLLNYFDVLKEYNLIKAPQSSKNGVQLSTAHGAKGREFDHVYIIGARDKHWGNRRRPRLFDTLVSPLDDGDVLGDERRLFYVALTRARKTVTLTLSKEDSNGREQLPSQFIAEIDDKLIKKIDTEAIEKSLASVVDVMLEDKVEASQIKDKEYLQELFLGQGLSVTALNNYLDCPWRYFFQNLVRLPQPYTKPLMYGNVIHYSLRDFYNSDKRALKNLIAPFQKYMSEQILTDVEMQELKERGEKALTGYFENYVDESQEKVLTEYSVSGIEMSFGKDGKKIGLRGNLDKLIKGEGTGVSVVDYKTGKPKSRNFIEGKTKDGGGNYKRQLTFYKLLLDEDGQYNMKEGIIDFIEPNERAKYVRESFIIEVSEVEELKSTIKEKSEEIYDLTFWNQRCDSKGCEYCRLRNLMD